MFLKVDKRWAIAITVLFFMMFCRAFWMAVSDSLSKAEVASSKIKIGVSFRIAEAMAILCLSRLCREFELVWLLCKHLHQRFSGLKSGCYLLWSD